MIKDIKSAELRTPHSFLFMHAIIITIHSAFAQNKNVKNLEHFLITQSKVLKQMEF